jgi:hypothetical protein
VSDLREALRRARNDLLAYGRHNDGQWVNKGGHPETHRKPGEPCDCGLDAAIALASAALGEQPQSHREHVAVLRAAQPRQEAPGE